MDGRHEPARLLQGFTLVELMVALVVVSILAAASVASYRQYLRRANRVDATAALLRIQNGEERFYLQNNRYAGPDELAAIPPDGLGMTGTEHGYYDLEVQAGPDGLALGYVAAAQAAPSGPQADDDECRTFFIDQSGRRGASTAGGDQSEAITARCWR
jgi:type IV pilus assembly protein PilE